MADRPVPTALKALPLYRRITAAQHAIFSHQGKLLRRTSALLPIGTQVTFLHGRMSRPMLAEVVGHGIYGPFPRVEVRNLETGARPRWVPLSSILRVLTDPTTTDPTPQEKQ